MYISVCALAHSILSSPVLVQESEGQDAKADKDEIEEGAEREVGFNSRWLCVLGGG